ncbi:hypothetical protein EDD90_4113 [Streptomyces sp. Ag109_O5-1]|nr:hypothetical protein EDD90_4113 [Streptomyces sp. Ag109_O5-1]
MAELLVVLATSQAAQCGVGTPCVVEDGEREPVAPHGSVPAGGTVVEKGHGVRVDRRETQAEIGHPQPQAPVFEAGAHAPAGGFRGTLRRPVPFEISLDPDKPAPPRGDRESSPSRHGNTEGARPTRA